MAEIFRLPTADHAVADDVARRSRDVARGTVDDWGRDDQLVRALGSAVRVRWRVEVTGVERLPSDGGALLVANHRRFALTPAFVTTALTEAVDRPVRVAIRSPRTPLDPWVRRLGGLLRDADEVRGALSHGEVVLVFASATAQPRRVGTVPVAMVRAAVDSRVPVHPVATRSSPLQRGATVDVGAAVRPQQRRRGLLGEVELADLTRRRLQELLDGSGAP